MWFKKLFSSKIENLREICRQQEIAIDRLNRVVLQNRQDIHSLAMELNGDKALIGKQLSRIADVECGMNGMASGSMC